MGATPKASTSTRRIFLTAIILAAIVGAVTGFGTSYLARMSPAPRSRDIYLFAEDLKFGENQTSGLTSDYIYSITHIVVNKGDTVTIHFYNPTDEGHSFTMDNPYLNDVVIPAATNTLIQHANITITASQIGTFGYHCKFHPPQMVGAFIVEG